MVLESFCISQIKPSVQIMTKLTPVNIFIMKDSWHLRTYW